MMLRASQPPTPGPGEREEQRKGGPGPPRAQVGAGRARPRGRRPCARSGCCALGPRADGAPGPARGARRATVRRAHGARTRPVGCPVARRRGRRLRPDAQERRAPAPVGGGQRGAAARGRAGSCGALAFPHPRPVAGRWRGSLAVPRPLEIEPGCCLHDGSGGRSLRGGGGERKRGVPAAAAAAAAAAGRGTGEPRAVPEARTREPRLQNRKKAQNRTTFGIQRLHEINFETSCWGNQVNFDPEQTGKRKLLER
ncbi:uncharacterized protein LOC142833289 [Microtus pennsylvanicus]|uniref:uncharacterized protein LOC142833289 n=1 Tax=Microtus pennsylvanicus TaxID=10058 RepID=UPI003F6D0662